MKFIHRLGFYLGGFSIGLIFLMFFLSGKKTSCAYGPNARVLKNITSKTLVINPNVKSDLSALSIDSLQVDMILKKGNVNFAKSDTSKEQCKRYTIEYDSLEVLVENCILEANLLEVSKKQN
jgi:hypothetical protein